MKYDFLVETYATERIKVTPSIWMQAQAGGEMNMEASLKPKQVLKRPTGA
jgi:hypothetical protein